MKNFTKTLLGIAGIAMAGGITWLSVELNDCKDKLHNCKDSEPLRPRLIGEPISRREVVNMSYDFSAFYKSANPAIDTASVYIKWKDLISCLDTANLESDRDTGIAAFYILSDTVASAPKYFTYALTVARVTRSGGQVDSVIPIGLYKKGAYVAGKYLMLRQDGNVQELTQDEVQYRRLFYQNNVLVRRNLTTTGTPVSALAATHPRVSFCDGESWTFFYNENATLPGIDSNTFYLVAQHGAIFKGQFVDYKGQTPLFICKNGNEYLLQDGTHPVFSYRYHGMDIGHLCPPDCKCQ